MGILKQRERRLMIRKIKDTMSYANKECYEEIIQLNNSSKICSCPECKSPKYVKYTGTNRGIKKFCCNNPIPKKKVWFSVSTSYNAMEVYRKKLIENLCLLAKSMY